MGEKDEGKYFSIDESLISHLGGKQVWFLGIIDNSEKDFRLEAPFKRDESTIKAFITKFVEKGILFAVTDGKHILFRKSPFWL